MQGSNFGLATNAEMRASVRTESVQIKGENGCHAIASGKKSRLYHLVGKSKTPSQSHIETLIVAGQEVAEESGILSSISVFS